VRLIAATNRELEPLMHRGAFREDLYYRLNVVTITVPPLRERRDDIPILVEAFVAEFAAANRKKITGVAPEALEALVAYDWPGNVRELRNAIESLIVLAQAKQITLEMLPAHIKEATSRTGATTSRTGATTSRTGAATSRTGAATSSAGTAAAGSVLLPPGTSLQEAERLLMEETLRKTDFNVSRAAKLLGVSRRTLHRKINEYGIRTDRSDAGSSS